MAMRITESITYSNFLRRIQELNRNYFKYNEQITTGKRINRPSDDPVDFADAVNLRNQYVNTAQYVDNIVKADRRLETTDARLNDVSLQLTRLIQLSEQGASTTTTGEPRAGIAQEVYALGQEMLDTADARFNGRAIFGGTRNTSASLAAITNNPDGMVYSIADYNVTLGGSTSGNFSVGFGDPLALNEHIYQIEIVGETAGVIDYEIRDLDSGNALVASGSAAAGDTITAENLNFTYNGGGTIGETYTALPRYAFNGTDENIEMQVGDNTKINQNVKGPDVFGGAEPTGTAQVPGNTLFDDLVEFRRALLTNDDAALLTNVDTIYGEHNNLNRVRAEAGGRISNLRSLETRTRAESAELLSSITEIEGADLAKSISDLVQADGGRQAALQAGAKIGQLNLFDFLG
jgi:flagellar hook-associated protein 3